MTERPLSHLRNSLEIKTDTDDPDFTVRFGDMQDMIDRKMRQAGRSADEMTTDEQQQFVDSTKAYVKFEGRDLKGLLISASGNGGFLAAQEDEVVGAQDMQDGDKIVGMISDFSTYPVPALHLIQQSEGGSIPTYNVSMSAVALLEGVRFYSGLRPDGDYDIEVDLSTRTILLPAAYRMQVEAADLYQL